MRHHRLGKLGAAWSLRAGDDEALDLDDRLLGGVLELRFLPGRCGADGRHDDLGQPGPVADDEKCYGLQLAAAVQPARDHDSLADVPGQFGGQDS